MECFVNVKNVAVSKKGGKTRAKAKSIAKGKKVTGVLFNYGETAWYKFKVTKKKPIKISLSSGMLPGTDFYVFRGKKKLYLEGEHPRAVFPDEGVITFKARKSLGTGTYYIKVRKDLFDTSGYYTIKWNYR